MNIILDTHYAYWSLYDSNRLSKNVREIIENPDNDIYVSAVSILELSIKHQKNPKLMQVSGEEFYQACLDNDFFILPIQAKIIKEFEDLNIKEDAFVNKDPFDRILVAQAKHYKYMLVTCDHCMKYYAEPYILIDNK